MNPTYKPPSELTDEEFDSIYSLILMGDEVNPATLRVRLQSASSIGFVRGSSDIASVAVMKNPVQDYKKRTFDKAGAGVKPESYEFELGYVYTHEAHRKKGYARRLCSDLCEAYREKSVYATTRVDNYHMQNTLAANYFQLSGNEYASDRDQSVLLNLFVKTSFKNKYHVDVSKFTFGSDVRWQSSVLKMPLPSSVSNQISMDDGVAFESKEAAIKDLLRRVKDLDFGNCLVLLMPTYERMLSFQVLEERLQYVG